MEVGLTVLPAPELQSPEVPPEAVPLVVSGHAVGVVEPRPAGLGGGVVVVGPGAGSPRIRATAAPASSKPLVTVCLPVGMERGRVVARTAATISAGVADGFAARTSATAPLT